MWCEGSVRVSCMWECERCMCDSMRVRVWLTVSVCVVTMWECVRMWGACVTVWGYECVKGKWERVACMCENVGVQEIQGCGWGCVVVWGSFTSSLSWQCTMKLFSITSLLTLATWQFIHCLLILLCLAVLCIVKPYKKFHINVVEALVIIALLGATVSVLDEQDVYVGQITSSCFIAFPFLYGAVFIIYRISRELSVYIW